MDFVYSASHEIFYRTEKPVPISDIIDSLQALEKILQNVPRVIEGSANVSILRSEFYIEKLESGSLVETVLVKLFFKDEDELNKFLDKIRENGVLRNTLVGAAFGGLVVYGAMLAANAMKSPAPNIQANNNTIINIGAGEVKLTPEEFRAVVEAAVSDKKELAKNSVKFLSPVKADPKASVIIDQNNSLQITPDAIRETPEKLDLSKQKTTVDLNGVFVVIRAADLDSKKSGWAGKIEGQTERLKIELDPAVNEADIYGKSRIQADVTIIYKLDGKGINLVPTAIFMRRIY